MDDKGVIDSVDFPVIDAAADVVVETGTECVIISKIGPEPRAYETGLNL